MKERLLNLRKRLRLKISISTISSKKRESSKEKKI
jgi:hypothetical protein